PSPSRPTPSTRPRVSALFLTLRPPTTSPLFPYTTLFRSGHTDAALKRAGTLGDAWHPISLRPPAMLRPDEYAQKVKQIHAWICLDRKSTRLNSSHVAISYAVFCLKKKQ